MIIGLVFCVYFSIGIGYGLGVNDHEEFVRFVRREKPNASVFWTSFSHTIFMSILWPYCMWLER